MSLPLKTEDTVAVDIINQDFEEKAAQQNAANLGYEYIDLAKFPINPDILSLIPLEQAESLKVVPYYRNGFQLKLAAIDPKASGLALLQEKFEKQRMNVSWAVCSNRGLNHILSLYNSDLLTKRTIELKHDFKESNESNFESQFLSFGDLEEGLSKLPAAESLNEIQIAALKVKASDIHIQPYQAQAVLRFRIDGILHDIATLQMARALKLVNFIKYEAGMRSNVSHIPQDGSLRFVANNRTVDLRVSTLPTETLESVVMRVLDSRKGLKSFSELGFDSLTENLIGRALSRKSGMLLVTGPTGSGKTTTLYAMLKELNSSEKKLVSFEDPVEYHLEGVTQSPVDENSDYSFANGLKALLRHDPDVILIGEIREGTTAKLASEAALTGHVVLSSLHTNSALGAVSRLRNLGLESFNIASAINAVFAQRLVRRVCPDCQQKEWVNLKDHTKVGGLLKTLEARYPGIKTSGKTKGQHNGETGIFLEIPKINGCEKCSHTGYNGQTVICETLWFTDELRDAIAKEMNEQGLKQLATVQNDSTSLFGDGLKKVILGETTLDEVYRVAG